MSTKAKATPPVADKDEVIAGLKAQIEVLSEALTNEQSATQAAHAQSIENFHNGNKWRDLVADERKKIERMQRDLEAANEARRYAESQLRFAEGFILALKGEPYPGQDSHSKAAW